MQSRFCVSLKAVKHLKASKENPFNAAKMKMKISAGTCINDCTRQIYTIVNQPFEKTFGISFAEGLTAMKEVNLVKKRSAYSPRTYGTSIFTVWYEQCQRNVLKQL